MNFEKGEKKLKAIVEELDSNDITLDRSIELFSEGAKITAECLEMLKESKGKITKIKEEFDKLIEVSIEDNDD